MGLKHWMASALMGAGLMTVAPTAAEAGPLGCAQAIAGCVGGGKKVADKIKTSRNACEALRDCKKVCRVDKREAKADNRDEKKDCIDSCKNKKGKAKRNCKQSCRQDKRADNKEARGEKRDCVADCKAQYKTPQCKDARKKMVAAIVGQGLKCAAQVAIQCPPGAP